MGRSLFLLLGFVVIVRVVKTCPTVGKHGEYSYDPSSEHGPSHWGSIEGFETCGKGKSQSPINVITYDAPPLSDAPIISYKLSVMELTEKVENWALDCPESEDCGFMMYKGETYKVANMHFHSPSEHTIDGQRYPLEAHVVHVNGDRITVMAFVFEFGMIPNAIPALAVSSVCRGTDKMMVAMELLMDPSDGVCAYSGSLTTPPCTEGVQFFIQRKPLQITEDELKKLVGTFSSPVDANDRPLQPLHGRSIMCSA